MNIETFNVVARQVLPGMATLLVVGGFIGQEQIPVFIEQGMIVAGGMFYLGSGVWALWNLRVQHKRKSVAVLSVPTMEQVREAKANLTQEEVATATAPGPTIVTLTGKVKQG